MTTHSSILAWRIPCTEESSGLQSIELLSLITYYLFSELLRAWILHSVPLSEKISVPPLSNM